MTNPQEQAQQQHNEPTSPDTTCDESNSNIYTPNYNKVSTCEQILQIKNDIQQQCREIKDLQVRMKENFSKMTQTRDPECIKRQGELVLQHKKMMANHDKLVRACRDILKVQSAQISAMISRDAEHTNAITFVSATYTRYAPIYAD